MGLTTQSIIPQKEYTQATKNLHVNSLYYGYNHLMPGVVKSLLRYPGGKTRGVKQILSLIPKNIKSLCSPFAGGGSIELACASLGVKVTAYDAFVLPVNFWQQILKNPKKLAQTIGQYYPLPRDKFYKLQKTYGEIKNNLEQAAAFFVLNRASFSGATLSGGMSPNHPRFTPLEYKLE